MAVSPYDLATLAQCKSWTNATASNLDDVTLQFLITAVSKQVIRQLGRNPLLNRVVEVRNGSGNSQMFVRQFPIARMNSVNIVGGTLGGMSFAGGLAPFSVPASGGGVPGYIYSDNLITLIGYRFPIGKANVYLDYIGGYTDVQYEPVTLASQDYTAQHASTFVQGTGVTYADGTPLVKVAASPSRGQYTVTTGTLVMFTVQGGGIYGFSADDIGANVILDYQYGDIPEDLTQIVVEAVAFLSASRKHIGQSANNMGGQGVRFIETALPPETLGKLQNFDSRVPVV